MRDQAVRSEFKELMLGYCRSAVSVAAVAGPRPPAEPGAEGGSQGGRPDAAGDCYLLAGGGRPLCSHQQRRPAAAAVRRLPDGRAGLQVLPACLLAVLVLCEQAVAHASCLPPWTLLQACSGPSGVARESWSRIEPAGLGRAFEE